MDLHSLTIFSCHLFDWKIGALQNIAMNLVPNRIPIFLGVNYTKSMNLTTFLFFKLTVRGERASFNFIFFYI